MMRTCILDEAEMSKCYLNSLEKNPFSIFKILSLLKEIMTLALGKKKNKLYREIVLYSAIITGLTHGNKYFNSGELVLSQLHFPVPDQCTSITQ